MGRLPGSTVESFERVGWDPSKEVKKTKSTEPVEHPKYKKAGPNGTCRRCGSKMEVRHEMPMSNGRTHVTYVCPKCRKPRVGVRK